MKQFVLTVDIHDNNVRDSVHIAQMVREAAATLEYQIPLRDHQHVYGPAGLHKYQWTIMDPEPVPTRARRAGSHR